MLLRPAPKLARAKVYEQSVSFNLGKLFLFNPHVAQFYETFDVYLFAAHWAPLR
jgi:hypothetical protein